MKQDFPSTSSSFAGQGLWYLHYKLFGIFLNIYVSYLLWQCQCMLLFVASLAFLALLVYSGMPMLKEQGAENYSAVVIGSGVAGINAGVRLNEMGVRYVVLEKAPRLGGTWWENQYPGCACDVASHLYSFSFFPNPWWSRKFSGQEEIRTYLEDVASYFRVYPNIRFNSKVSTVDWDEKSKIYTVTCADGQQYKANFVISGAGGLHKPAIPEFKGVKDFQGTVMHSAQWDSSVQIKGKKVAIIGTGASCVQILPNIVKDVESVHVFQRTAAWVAPRFDGQYKSITKWLFALVPFLMTLYRYSWFWIAEMRFYIFFGSTRHYLGPYMRKQVLKYYDHHVKDPETRKKLIPPYEIGCKRFTPSDTYLQAYNQPNAHLVTDPIDGFTSTGIATKKDGATNNYDFDVVILATGFDLLGSFKSYNTFGTDKSKSLSEEWGNRPSAYNGTVVPNYPNLFILLGPNTALGHNSIIYIIECQTNYAMDCIRKVIREGAKSIEVRQEPYKKFQRYLKESLKSTVWFTGCASWYLNENGETYILWPTNIVYFWKKLFAAEREDFIVKH